MESATTARRVDMRCPRTDNILSLRSHGHVAVPISTRGTLRRWDILTPTPGWLPADNPAPGSPAQGARTMARAWAESLLMTDHLVAHASRWMLTFHDFFLNKSAAVSALMHARPVLLFLAHQTRTTYRPRFARRRPLHGVAFASAAHAPLRYAIG